MYTCPNCDQSTLNPADDTEDTEAFAITEPGMQLYICSECGYTESR